MVALLTGFCRLPSGHGPGTHNRVSGLDRLKARFVSLVSHGRSAAKSCAKRSWLREINLAIALLLFLPKARMAEDLDLMSERLLMVWRVFCGLCPTSNLARRRLHAAASAAIQRTTVCTATRTDRTSTVSAIKQV